MLEIGIEMCEDEYVRVAADELEAVILRENRMSSNRKW